MAVHAGAGGGLTVPRPGRVRAAAAAVGALLAMSGGAAVGQPTAPSPAARSAPQPTAPSAPQPSAAQPAFQTPAAQPASLPASPPGTPPLPRFSAMAPGATPAGWAPLRPSRSAPDTRYTLEPDASGVTVLRADADRSMSGLVVATDPPRDLRGWRLRWRWKVAGPVPDGDPRRRSGDDYAARIYVTFEHPPESLQLTLRAKLALVEAATGRRPPSAALNYVWDAAQPPGTILPNPYTDRVRMVVLRSGPAQAGQWITETRDLEADYRAAFDEPMPPVSGVALASDADDTGGRATAWFGDLEWVPPGR